MVTISIKDLVVEAKHGVHEHEKQQPQRFIFNVEATINTQANISDDLADSLSYTDLKNSIIEVTQSNSFNLIERLAQAVADQILTHHEVQKVVVAIDKPDVFKNGVPGVRLEVISGGNG
ncbi:MAG TPA: dihydroneopterin aldolase [Candidatus Saccharimonadales bacterium]